MADPYAKRFDDLAASAPAGQPPWLEAVRAHLEGGPGCLVIADAGPIAPIARAGINLIEALRQLGGRWIDDRDREAASDESYLLKHGWVAGPPGEPGCVEITRELLVSVLEAERDPAREIIWERDPDFGYEVPARVEGLDEVATRILCPRLHYADHDRVYEYAELVAATKQRWFERLSEMGGIADEVLAATGWPPQPTGDEWRERTR